MQILHFIDFFFVTLRLKSRRYSVSEIKTNICFVFHSTFRNFVLINAMNMKKLIFIFAALMALGACQEKSTS